MTIEIAPHPAVLPPQMSTGTLAKLRRIRIINAMCTLAIYLAVSADHPLVIAANRDELYERPAAAPQIIASAPWIVAGRDLVAGGTWLGVNEHGLVAGLLNRRSHVPPDPRRASRGQLCVGALQHSSLASAAAAVCAEAADRYNPFNLLLATPQAACVIGNVSGTMSHTELTRGLHLLTNLDLNDMECPRIAKSYALFEAAKRFVEAADIEALLPALRTILADHSTPLDPRSTGPPNNLCVHGERFGTRSSSVLVYNAQQQRFRMWHADGPPCETEYREVVLPYSDDSADSLRKC